jgi:hypothetical protein
VEGRALASDLMDAEMNGRTYQNLIPEREPHQFPE